jgi:hypothetical protein
VDLTIGMCGQYVVIPGNNSKLVLDAMRNRRWWGPVGPEYPMFNFLWEQWSSPRRFLDLKTTASFKQVINHVENHLCISQKKVCALRSSPSGATIGTDVLIPCAVLIPEPEEVLKGQERTTREDHTEDVSAPGDRSEPTRPKRSRTMIFNVCYAQEHTPDEVDTIDSFRRYYLQLEERVSREDLIDSWSWNSSRPPDCEIRRRTQTSRTSGSSSLQLTVIGAWGSNWRATFRRSSTLSWIVTRRRMPKVSREGGRVWALLLWQ